MALKTMWWKNKNSLICGLKEAKNPIGKSFWWHLVHLQGFLNLTKKLGKLWVFFQYFFQWTFSHAIARFFVMREWVNHEKHQRVSFELTEETSVARHVSIEGTIHCCFSPVSSIVFWFIWNEHKNKVKLLILSHLCFLSWTIQIELCECCVCLHCFFQ